MVAEELYKVQLGFKKEAIRTKTNEEGEMRIALRLRLSMNSSGFKEGRAFGRGKSMNKGGGISEEGSPCSLGAGKAPWRGGSSSWSWRLSRPLEEGPASGDLRTRGLKCPGSLTS